MMSSMLGQVTASDGDSFTVAIDREPIIAVLKVSSIGSKTLRASVQNQAVPLIVKMEDDIMQEFCKVAHFQCGFDTEEEMTDFADETFVSAAGLRAGGATVKLTLDETAKMARIKPEETYTLRLRPVAISGRPEVLKIKWSVEKVSLPNVSPAGDVNASALQALDAIATRVQELKAADDIISVVSWLVEHRHNGWWNIATTSKTREPSGR